MDWIRASNQNPKLNQGKSTGFQLMDPALPLSNPSNFVMSSVSREKS
jgi:hypothetical protein